MQFHTVVRRGWIIPALASAALAGCSGSASAPQKPVPPPEAPTLRLPRTVMPTAYEATISIDPAEPQFAGAITIRATAAEPVTTFWLNAQGLDVSEATLRTKDGADEVLALEIIPTKADFIGFRAPRAFSGEVEVGLRYTGTIEDNDTYGVFRQKAGGDWYVFTQFEALAARRAFPSFDEPDNKVPWTVALEVPANLEAYFNTPAVAVEPRGETKLVRFAPTKPLPTYLLSFAVGPFERVDAGQSASGVPIGIITPKGRAADAAYAAASTDRLLSTLEAYFGITYPYAKLDSIAVPLTVGFGAMEHPGLITYVEEIILAPPNQEPLEMKKKYGYVGAHELGHQWFGNLVTPVWWDDIWLNEAFASWIEFKAIEKFEPAWEADVNAVNERADAIINDHLRTARQIRQPIETNDDINSAFDGITYGKGAAVIGMFEQWVGAEAFRNGVQRYLEKFAWKNATAADFLASIGEAAGRDVATPFNTFLEQNGVPQLNVALTCATNERPKLLLAQTRYVPHGSSAETRRSWQIAVCVRFGTGARAQRQCTLLTEGATELELDTTSCPSWVLPNAGGIGYYHSKLDEGLLVKLFGEAWTSLTDGERVTLLSDVLAQVRAGALPRSLAWKLAAPHVNTPSNFVMNWLVALYAPIEQFLPAALMPAYAKLIRDTFGERAAALGWREAPTDGPATIELRQLVVPLVANEGQDAALRAEAKKLAIAWLADHSAVSDNVAPLVLATAVRTGDTQVFESILTLVKTEPDRRARKFMLNALAAVRDEAQAERVMALLFDPQVDLREVLRMLQTITNRRALNTTAARVAWRMLGERRDELMKRMPVTARADIARVAQVVCDAGERDAVVAFLEEHVRPERGGPRAAEQALEQFELCVAQQQQELADFERTFAAPQAAPASAQPKR